MEEEFIMERNAKGVVKIDGITCKVPKGTAALAIVGNNYVSDREEYKEDGYIYKGGKKVRKWYLGYDIFRYWLPDIDNIFKLERQRWAVYGVFDRYLKTTWQPLMRELQQCKTADYHIGDSANGRTWIRYTWKKTSNGVDGMSWDYLDNIKKPKNIISGKKIYEAEEIKWKKINKAQCRTNVLLYMAVRKHYYNNMKTNFHGRGIVKYIINDREYWFDPSKQNEHFLATPEDVATFTIRASFDSARAK